jgi:hypothetical protein
MSVNHVANDHTEARGVIYIAIDGCQRVNQRGDSLARTPEKVRRGYYWFRLQILA